MQTAAIVVSVAVTLVAVALAGRAIGQIVGVIRLGQPVLGRTDQPARRTVTMLRETLGHTRMLKWSLIGASHWFVFIGFGLLFFTLLTAYGQLFDAEFVLPLIGGAHPFEWAAEVITWAMLVGITVLVGDPAAGPSGAHRPNIEIHWIADVAGLLRRGHGHRRRHLHPGSPRVGICAGRRRREPLSADVLHRRRARRPADVDPGEPGLLGRRSEDPRLHGLADRDRPQCHHGRGVAPLHCVPQCLFQTGSSTAPMRSVPPNR